MRSLQSVASDDLLQSEEWLQHSLLGIALPAVPQRKDAEDSDIHLRPEAYRCPRKQCVQPVAWTGVEGSSVEVFAMSKFFVGQMVRVVRPWRDMTLKDWLNWPRLQGAEGRVTEVGCTNSFREVGIAIMVSNEEWILPEYGLEPILPGGHRASDYSLAELLDRCNQGEGVPA